MSNSESHPPLRRYLTGAAAAAVYLGRTEAAVWHLVSRRRIPFSKRDGVLMFDTRALDRWVAKGMVDPDAGRPRKAFD